MICKIDEIHIGPRARRKFAQELIEELATSLEQYGQLHPVIVRSGPNGLELVSGHRRILAAKLLAERGSSIRGLAPGEVMASDFGELPEDEAKELELEENLRRVDLTWKEVALATAEIHRLKKEKDPNWTVNDTQKTIARLTGTDPNIVQVKKRLLLAENLHRPSVARATSEKQAIKALTTELENEFRSRMLSDSQSSMHIVEWCDARDGIPEHIKEPCVDLILTDPPYGMDAESFNVDSVVASHNYIDAWDKVFPMVSGVLALATRVCKPQAFLYMFCEFSRFPVWCSVLEDLGWEPWPRPLIWVKNKGYAPKPNHGPRYTYECILFANRGRREMLKLAPDVLQYNLPTERQHAAQKPDELFIDLIQRSVPPGSVILDPFCGSGTALRAAIATKCRAICFDKDPDAIVLAKECLR